jgi:hypothetical protein
MIKEVTELATTSELLNVKIPKDLIQRIEPVFKKATGVKPVIQDFVAQAVLEKLNSYEKIVADGKKRSA